MRYTTVIDIREVKECYRNINARLIYLHLALMAGWHDTDRDLVDISIRGIAYTLGLSLSATRHALKQLEKGKLIKRQGTLWWVRKWELEEEPSRRPRTKKEQKTIDAAAERKRIDEQRELEHEVERKRRLENLAAGKTSYMLWYEQELKKAETGDEEAKRTVEKNKAAYEKQKAQMQQQINKMKERDTK